MIATLLFILLQVIAVSVEAQVSCEISSSWSILALRYNTTAGAYQRLTRRLREQGDKELISEHEDQSYTLAFLENNRQLHDGQKQSSPRDGFTVSVRPCSCRGVPELDRQYCPLQYNICEISEDDISHRTCSVKQRRRNFARGFMPAMIFFYSCLLYVFLVSEQGSSARSYIFRKTAIVVLFLRQRSSNSSSSSGSNFEEERALREWQLLNSSVDRLQIRNPDRAAWLYRNTVTRRRIARRAQHLRDIRNSRREEQGRQQRRLRRNNNNNNDEGDDDDDASDNATPAAANEESDTPAIRPTHLALKTTTYEADDSVKKQTAARWTPFGKKTTTADGDNDNINDNDENAEMMEQDMVEGTRCAICLASFQNGDRVGDLPCAHVFHVDCLKAWLRRKNQCPLCNCSDIASPCKAPPTTTMTTTTKTADRNVVEENEDNAPDLADNTRPANDDDGNDTSRDERRDGNG